MSPSHIAVIRFIGFSRARDHFTSGTVMRSSTKLVPFGIGSGNKTAELLTFVRMATFYSNQMDKREAVTTQDSLTATKWTPVHDFPWVIYQ